MQRVSQGLLLLAVLVAVGCHSRHRGDVEPDADITLDVINHNWLDVTVYVLHDGERTRLGLVTASSTQSFTLLAPRQSITATPYALRSLNSATADKATDATNAINATNATNAVTANNAQQLAGVAASQYVLTGDARLSNSRTPTAGSSNYIQNTTNQQTSGNFNISGGGTAPPA